MEITMKLIRLYAYFFFTFIFLSGCSSTPKFIETEPPIDFQFVTVKEGDTFPSLAEKYNGSAAYSWRIEEFNNSNQLKPGQELIIPLKPFIPGGLTAQGYQLIPVLSYHNFSKGRSHNKLTISVKNFRKQLNYLKNNGYHVITMVQLVEFINFGQVPEKSVLISIDDGWISSYEIAYPILREFGFNATLFIPTQYIDSGNKKAVNWSQIKEMLSDNTIDIQCHGKAHRDLSTRKENESFSQYIQAVEKDISNSRQNIYDKLGIQVSALAYPFGRSNPLVMEMLKKQGYKIAFTVKRNGIPFYKQRFLLNRSMIYGSMSINKFAENLKHFASFPVAEPEPIDTLPSLASLALEAPEKYEHKKQWRTARMIWKLRRDALLSQRQTLAVTSPDSSSKLRSLKKSIEAAQYKVLYITYKLNDIAKQHYLAATNTISNDQAKKLLLQALLDNPEYQSPIDHFQSNMGKLKPLTYVVKENDSFASIARQLYKDPKKAILIPLFNHNVSNESELIPGIKLSLPAAPVNVKKASQAGSKRCSISLTKSSRQMADDYYTKALENFNHDQISQAIESLKTAICLNPKHSKAVEMLNMLKDL
ncbi:MAG: polysaccharide deacetylase family protein [Methyloprofundus sp.]|nr:polysaccharide deacetylase family protein [Methyloprofundus sp.]